MMVEFIASPLGRILATIFVVIGVVYLKLAGHMGYGPFASDKNRRD